MNTHKRPGSYATSLLIGALGLLIALSACGKSTVSQSNENGGSTAATTDSKARSTTASAPAPPITGGDAAAVVTNAHQLLKSQKAYRVRSTSTTSMGGQPITSLREVVAPDRMHNVADGREIIVIGRTMYVKKGGAWQNMGTQMSDMTDKFKKNVQDMSPDEKAQATKGLSADYKSLPDEELDGVATAVYEMHSQLDTHVEGVGAITTVTKIWISKSDGLIRKEVSDGNEAGMKVHTTRLYEYDPSITIEAPIS